jgi:NAD(P)H-dependent flavin oxidoreductase YrpB (nitropropane dioxygenase family)
VDRAIVAGPPPPVTPRCGAALARALRVGAQGASLGTRFVASEEAWVRADDKRRIVAGGAADTVYTTLFDIGWPDAPHRKLRDRVVREWAAGPAREWPRYAVGMAVPTFDGDIEDAPLWAGESCEVVDGVKPAAAIVADLVRQAEAALAREPA